MWRRELLGLIGGAAAWPIAARAQQPTVPMIGYLSGLAKGDRPALVEAFQKGLALAGYADGRNVAIEYRFAENQPARLPSLAADLIARRVAVIAATGGNNSGLVAKTLTSTIPIVFTSGLDPVKAGLVNSLDRPEANVTGISFFTVELGQKHVELMRELAPSARLIGVVLNRNNPESALYEQSVIEGARALGLQLLVLNGATPAETEDAFAEFSRQRVNGIIISADPNLTGRTTQITALAARLAVPAVYSNREHPVAGGLISYGNNLVEVYKRAGLYAGRMLKGDKPSDLPVERATRFELVVNMKTAQALGIDIPLSLQMRIDEVID